jgi:hypothetical protein
VRLHEHALVHGDLQLVGDFGDALFFGLAAAIGEEDEGYALFLEVGEGLAGGGDRRGGAEEDAIDAGEGG